MFTGARKKRGNGMAAGCQLFYRKIYGYFLQCIDSVAYTESFPVVSKMVKFLNKRVYGLNHCSNLKMSGCYFS